MKRIFVTIILFILLLTGCASQPTAAPTETVTPQPTATSLRPTETHTPIPSPTACVESELPYEQQKTMIENRFERGSQAFEALIKEDGNLEYYDGSWHTLEAMRNVNGEIIPWGESYDMNSEEGRNGILTNIMGGNEALMEKHIQILDNRKDHAAEKGFDSSHFDVLYVQFFPNLESLKVKNFSEKVICFNMTGKIVVKNSNGKILVINIETVFSDMISHTYVASENILSQKPTKLYREKAFDNGFLGINSGDYLNHEWNDLNTSLTDSADRAALEKILNSNSENFLQKLETNPSSISDYFYNLLHIIYHNH